MHRLPLNIVFCLLVVLAASISASAQPAPGSPPEPFKLGTFEIDGEPRLGIVLRDSIVVELSVANRALESDPAFPRIPMPSTMQDLIGQYEYGLKVRLSEIVANLTATKELDANPRARFIHEAAKVKTLPPLMYPGKILNAAGNFYSHLGEGGTAEEQRKAAEERRAKRGVPYLFLKPGKGAVIGQGDAVKLPHGRDRIDWEVELSTVIGRAAKYVSATNAQDHIFGYTIMLDISDRGGRPPGGFSSGSDWFVGKGHDTFAPMGPWIVPKEFYGDPMTRLRQTLSVAGQQMQEATAGDMIHSVYEVIEYASSIITLFPGDVINAGTSGGVGMGRAVRGKQVFMQSGDQIVASIDGIGTLTLPVVAEEPPRPGTGSFLPPVSSYRK